MLLPLSFDLREKPILLVGGGKAALEKFSQLKLTGAALKIVTLKFSPEMEAALKGSYASTVSIERREFALSDLDGIYMVFSAIDDTDISDQIFKGARERNILINSADDKMRCDFYTNALVSRGNVQISVSTGGRFAGLSAVLRRHLEQLLPAELDEDWEKIFALRERAVALQTVSEKKSVITDMVRDIENKYFKKNQEP